MRVFCLAYRQIIVKCEQHISSISGTGQEVRNDQRGRFKTFVRFEAPAAIGFCEVLPDELPCPCRHGFSVMLPVSTGKENRYPSVFDRKIFGFLDPECPCVKLEVCSVVYY